MLVRRALALVATVALALTPAAALAQDTSSIKQDESQLPYVLAAFAVAWAGFFVYVFYLERKVRQLRRELEEASRELRERRPRP